MRSIAASGDWYELVDFSAHRMRSLQRLVDRLATDGAHIVCGQHSCPELSAPVPIVDAHVPAFTHGTPPHVESSSAWFLRSYDAVPLPWPTGLKEEGLFSKGPVITRYPSPMFFDAPPGYLFRVPPAGFEPATMPIRKEK